MIQLKRKKANKVHESRLGAQLSGCRGHLSPGVFISTRVKKQLYDGEMTVRFISHAAESSSCGQCCIAVLIWKHQGGGEVRGQGGIRELS